MLKYVVFTAVYSYSKLEFQKTMPTATMTVLKNKLIYIKLQDNVMDGFVLQEILLVFNIGQGI